MVITIGTLLAALQGSIGSPGAAPIEQQYIDLLNNPQAIDRVSIATNRVPDFTPDGIQKPLNGYRYLGLLADAPFEFTYPSTTWNPSQDILAVHEVGQNPISRDFAHVWEPSGLQLTTHFILIFIYPPLMYVQQPSRMSFQAISLLFTALQSQHIPPWVSHPLPPSLYLMLIM
jgi:hypothetical protein